MRLLSSPRRALALRLLLPTGSAGDHRLSWRASAPTKRRQDAQHVDPVGFAEVDLARRGLVDDLPPVR
eukprot:5808280-Alexandrium_andersonii.AAC.1